MGDSIEQAVEPECETLVAGQVHPDGMVLRRGLAGAGSVGHMGGEQGGPLAGAGSGPGDELLPGPLALQEPGDVGVEGGQDADLGRRVEPKALKRSHDRRAVLGGLRAWHRVDAKLREPRVLPQGGAGGAAGQPRDLVTAEGRRGLG
jgi:hypothetical protein